MPGSMRSAACESFSLGALGNVDDVIFDSSCSSCSAVCESVSGASCQTDGEVFSQMQVDQMLASSRKEWDKGLATLVDECTSRVEMYINAYNEVQRMCGELTAKVASLESASLV